VKAKGKHRGVITRTAEAVFEALLYLVEKYGKVFPSLEGLAHLARCCRQSVVTALDDLEALGFVTRIRRVRRVETPLGFKVVQTTNAYRVHEPVRGLGLLALLLFGKSTRSNYPRASEANFLRKQGNGNEGEETAAGKNARCEDRSAELGGWKLLAGHVHGSRCHPRRS
jgi:hypothetical protein